MNVLWRVMGCVYIILHVYKDACLNKKHMNVVVTVSATHSPSLTLLRVLPPAVACLSWPVLEAPPTGLLIANCGQ